jgi:peroxiredoxin Q/BCP
MIFNTRSRTLKTGDMAPDFMLKDQHNKMIRLSDFRHKKNLVLFFYPKDDTPVCTLEAKCFRDNYSEFYEQDTEVIGVSTDTVGDHTRFADKHKLPYTIVSDIIGKVRDLYGISPMLFVIPARVTFVIDKKGVIRDIYSSPFHASRHVERALEIVKSLN